MYRVYRAVPHRDIYAEFYVFGAVMPRRATILATTRKHIFLAFTLAFDRLKIDDEPRI